MAAVYPPQVSPASLLYVSGSLYGFGGESLRIAIANVSCSLRDEGGDLLSAVHAPSLPLTINSSAVCKTPDVPAGLYNVSVNLPEFGTGSALGSALRSAGLEQLFMIEQRAVVSSVTPGKVSVAGGVPLVLTGSGFSLLPAENMVAIGGIACPVTAATTTTLHVMAPDVSSVNFATQCVGRGNGGNVTLPAAGIGAVNVGPRGVRYQAWLPANVSITTPPVTDIRLHPKYVHPLLHALVSNFMIIVVCCACTGFLGVQTSTEYLTCLLSQTVRCLSQAFTD